ncbi:MAG: mechanosensitive ion channel family protein [Phycisphaerales bacterium]
MQAPPDQATADPAPPAGATEAASDAAVDPTVLGNLTELVSWAVPWLVLVVVFVLVLLGLNHFLLVRPTLEAQSRLRRRVVMLVLTVLAVLVSILAMPIDQSTKVAILQILGLAVTALITLSSTTIAANFMAGLMLGRVGAFRSGDFIDVAGNFGRVTARGLFHVEIQTEQRDLVTLPNAYMITHPVRVVRQSGTIVTCTISLGYDEPHTKIERLLVEAAGEAGLAECYVQILELGDFSVSYRVCGFLEDVQPLITVRSRLRARVLDTLHGAGVEIVSPTFMNQRQTPERFIPPEEEERGEPASAESPESIIFDKADDAVRLERVREALASAKDKLKQLESGEADGEGEEVDKEERKAEIAHQKTLVEYLTSRVDRMERRANGHAE